MEELLTLIGAGSDMAMIAVAVALYRLDRRVFKLEIEREKLCFKK